MQEETGFEDLGGPFEATVSAADDRGKPPEITVLASWKESEVVGGYERYSVLITNLVGVEKVVDVHLSGMRPRSYSKKVQTLGDPPLLEPGQSVAGGITEDSSDEYESVARPNATAVDALFDQYIQQDTEAIANLYGRGGDVLTIESLRVPGYGVVRVDLETSKSPEPGDAWDGYGPPTRDPEVADRSSVVEQRERAPDVSREPDRNGDPQ